MNRHGLWSFVRVSGVAALGACTPEAGPRDILLTDTLVPESGEIIDCRGGSILPATLASDNGGLSVPDTLIYLGTGVEGVRIENCTLDATFPIVALEGGFHEISHNNIDSTGRSVMFVGSGHNLVDHNVMTTSGRNLMIIGDADFNVVSHNDLTFVPDRYAQEGSPGLAVPGEPDGVGLGTFSYPGVENVIVNGSLHQHAAYRDTHPDGTLVVENTIHNDSAGAGIIFATRSSHASAYRNTVTGGELGLAVFGYDDFSEFVEPGTCSGDPSMYCGANEDEEGSFVTCDLPGFEPRGTCEGLEVVTGGGRVVAPTFVGNRVTGAYFGATAGFSDGFTIEGNDLRDGVNGIELWGYALDDGTVRGNVTSGNEVGLLISDGWPRSGPAGVDLSYNDFGDNLTPFDAQGRWTEDTPLPDNWWGSDPCGFPEDPEWWPNTYDPSPAAEPIAMAWRRDNEDEVPVCSN